ncbi:MAG TPA: hypothetical protein VHC91_12185 [Trinickia sp.]|uniref:hypothetical protein n=1 Tax=Trinickia sp. TaxID=2571163 RepID=UPI002BEB5B88|nr:hypothetical protein [Trinickia sp.]HVW51135.1 hypothetical protein [Trinickia sp.]
MEDPICIEFPFTLKIGLRGDDGALHRDGIMRLATAADEIVSMRDSRVQANPAYQPIIVLSRVIIKLGVLEVITPAVMETLFMADYNQLLKLYEEINQLDAESGERAVPGQPLEAFPGNVESLPFQASFMRR